MHEQGTANVNVTNSPLPVRGDVGLSSAANTVKVDSSSTNPVSITSVNDGQNPYADNGFAILPMGLAGAVATGSFTVPSAQRAVIEEVGVKIRVPTGAVIQSVGLIAQPGGTFLVPVKMLRRDERLGRRVGAGTPVPRRRIFRLR